MQFYIHHHYHDPAAAELLKRLVAIERKLDAMHAELQAALDKLTKEVAETREADESIMKLVDGLADQLRLVKDSPAKILELANALDAQQQSIAAKVLENTPAEPE